MEHHPESTRVSDVIIIGGGLAGLCSAIDLSGKGLSVQLFEKEAYPRHKVCGEYVSNETLPYLSSLGIDPFDMGAVRINELEFSGPDGDRLKTELPLGGFGISRFRLDSALYEKAREEGASIEQDRVESIDFKNDEFLVRTRKGQVCSSRFVIGAFGKRSTIDKKLGRQFIRKKSSYVAVKAHYKGVFPENLVGLHNFEGGYCGVSNVEDRKLNICYLVNYEVFQRYKDLNAFQEEVLKQNKQLASVLSNAQMIFEKPLTISQISFDRKELLVDHILMCGDSAGLIHPLCGNGMGMAIGGARLVSEVILSYFNGQLKSREEVEKHYVRSWNQNFRTRLRTGHSIAALLRFYKISFFLLPVLRRFPSLLHRLIKLTHGKPVVVI